MSGVSNSSGHRKIASRPCSCDAVATALQKLVLKYDTACILSYGESRTNQASLIINAQRHPDKASAVVSSLVSSLRCELTVPRVQGHLVCKLGVVPDANGNAVTVFELDSLPNAFLRTCRRSGLELADRLLTFPFPYSPSIQSTSHYIGRWTTSTAGSWCPRYRRWIVSSPSSSAPTERGSRRSRSTCRQCASST